MLKAVEKLINSTKKSHKIGNHSKEAQDNNTIKYYYHYHVIAVQNDNDKTMFFPYVGLYCDNVSTKQAVNSYRQGLAEKGYTEITAPYCTY
jgi:hypothetical protein